MVANATLAYTYPEKLTSEDHKLTVQSDDCVLKKFNIPRAAKSAQKKETLKTTVLKKGRGFEKSRVLGMVVRYPSVEILL